MKIPFSENRYPEIIDIGQAAVDFIRHHFTKQDFEAEVKDHDNSLVSFVDREAEKIITGGLTQMFPDHGFITEEDTIAQDDQKDYYWIIDPLDGTTNFLHGLEAFSVSIALSDRNHQLLWGMVIDVMKQEVFYAAAGHGAYKNGSRISVGNSSLSESLISTGFPYYTFENKAEYLQYLESFMSKCHGIRRCGSAALDMVHVAAGIYGGFFEFNLHLWDIAAGAVIVREAGGMVTDFEKKEENWKKTGHVVAGNPRCHGDMFDKVIDSK